MHRQPNGGLGAPSAKWWIGCVKTFDLVFLNVSEKTKKKFYQHF